MHILLVSHAEITRNPRALSIARSLADAGHRVTAVCGEASHRDIPNVEVHRIPTRVPKGFGKLGRALRRMQPDSMRLRWFERRLRRAVAAVPAEIVYPVSRRDVATVIATVTADQAIFREPHWDSAGARDIVDLAPTSIRFSSSPAGPPASFFTPSDHRAGRSPEPGRHQGKRIAFVYRRTETTPAQYLEEAARRAGMTVDRFDCAVDWSRVHPETSVVVFIESLYPALEVTGSNDAEVPVLYWVHHGEHHLAANLRLTQRYGAHAVLLAHSWHLAHRFTVPVHRFPFAVAPELHTVNVPFARRTLDIAMVGAGVTGTGGRYARRQQMADTIRHALPHSSAFISAVVPEEMAKLYGDARIVLNEGGNRHHPVTMRTFEAIASGALLLTDEAPGLSLLFDGEEHYSVINDDNVVAQIESLLEDPQTAMRAEAAHDHANEHHLYDHRIDELLEIASMTEVFPATPAPKLTGLVGVIHEDLDVNEVALFGLESIAGDLHTHIVWDGGTLLRGPSHHVVDAVILGPGNRYRLDTAAERAARFIYATPEYHEELEKFVQRRWPDATCSYVGDILRVDLGASSYRSRSRFGGTPLAGA